MKTVLLGILAMGLASSALAVTRAQLDDRIQSITEKFTAMQENPATRVPASKLAQAQGIVLLDRTHGAFFVGVHGGNGVALVRNASGQWSPAGFVTSGGASLGPQIGGGKDFYVVLLMSPAAVDKLKQSKIDFAAQASATGGSQHTGAETPLESQPPVMVYSQHNGLYAGASIKGGTIKADNDANAVYYNRALSMEDILFNHQVAPSAAEAALISKIEENSR